LHIVCNFIFTAYITWGHVVWATQSDGTYITNKDRNKSINPGCVTSVVEITSSNNLRSNCLVSKPRREWFEETSHKVQHQESFDISTCQHGLKRTLKFTRKNKLGNANDVKVYDVRYFHSIHLPSSPVTEILVLKLPPRYPVQKQRRQLLPLVLITFYPDSEMKWNF
jgi:hypothetical protein